MQPPPKKLLDQVRDAIGVKHYSYRTEETYVQWIRRYIFTINGVRLRAVWHQIVYRL
jgi:Phage integrase, N-terminal SAM-like domain